MQESIQLEVSLEIIMAEIALRMNKLLHSQNDEEKKKIENELDLLIELQDKAYKGDRNSVLKILKKEF